MLFSKSSPSKLLTDPLQITNESFDFIVVGGGTAGCVVASRLSENPEISVLLLEAGGSGKAVPASRMPLAFPKLMRGDHDWHLTSQPMPDALNRSIYLPRGKFLGGCSASNAMIVSYGAPGDFDEYAKIIGDDAWKWDNFKQYFKKFEKYTPHPEHTDIPSEWKGTDGPISIGFNGWVDPIHRVFVNACQTVGIPYNPDFNSSGTTIGANRFMTYVDTTGVRSTSETGYLTDSVLERPNLKVLVGAACTKIITRGEGKDTIAIGVEFKSRDGELHKVTTKREVILSAGAIHSPHILLLSGIGPASEITKHNIAVVADLPGVGKNLKEHATVPLSFKRNTADSAKYVKPNDIWDKIKNVAALLSYFALGKGVYTSNIVEAGCFVRSDDRNLFPVERYPADLTDTSSGKDSPDLEIFTRFLGFTHGEGAKSILPMHSFGMQVVLLRPKSSGSVTLASADPSEAPIFHYNFFSDREDLLKMVRGVRLMLRITQAEPLCALIDTHDTNPHLDHVLNDKTDEELEEVIKNYVDIVYHPAGTCKMAPLDQSGVVDSRLRVYGVGRLRVCDISILPETVAGHTAGPALALGEFLADVIQKELL